MSMDDHMGDETPHSRENWESVENDEIARSLIVWAFTYGGNEEDAAQLLSRHLERVIPVDNLRAQVRRRTQTPDTPLSNAERRDAYCRMLHARGANDDVKSVAIDLLKKKRPERIWQFDEHGRSIALWLFQELQKEEGVSHNEICHALMKYTGTPFGGTVIGNLILREGLQGLITRLQHRPSVLTSEEIQTGAAEAQALLKVVRTERARHAHLRAPYLRNPRVRALISGLVEYGSSGNSIGGAIKNFLDIDAPRQSAAWLLREMPAAEAITDLRLDLKPEEVEEGRRLAREWVAGAEERKRAGYAKRSELVKKRTIAFERLKNQDVRALYETILKGTPCLVPGVVSVQRGVARIQSDEHGNDVKGPAVFVDIVMSQVANPQETRDRIDQFIRLLKDDVEDIRGGFFDCALGRAMRSASPRLARLELRIRESLTRDPEIITLIDPDASTQA